MSACPHCGSPNEDGAQFSASCGTSLPVAVVQPARTSPWGTVLIVVGLVALAAASFAVTRAVRDNGSSAASPPPTSDATDGTSAKKVVASSTTVATTTTSTVDGATTTIIPTTAVSSTSSTSTVAPTTVGETFPPPATTTTTTFVAPDAITLLDTDVNDDRAVVEGLVGFWVTQLSSKSPGMVVNGITLTADDVLATHRRLQAEFGTVLLSSNEYNFKTPDLYVDIVPQGFADPDSALQLCFDQGIGRDDCFAKFITHDMTLTHTTKLQP